MFNKYKKKILLILTLVFLFNFSFGYKRADASVLVAGGVGLAVVLLVGAGVAITSPQMAKDLGSRLWQDMKEVFELPSKVGDFFKVQITGAMIEFVAKWLNGDNIPTEPVNSTLTGNLNFPLDLHVNNLTTHVDVTFSEALPFKTFDITGIFTEDSNVEKINLKTLGENTIGKIERFQILSYKFGWSDIRVAARFIGNGKTYDNIFVYTKDIYKALVTIDNIVIDGKSINTQSFSSNVVTTIPYDPSVSSGASEEKLTTSLPVGSTVTYPSDLTTNFPATADKPIANVTDIPNVNVDVKTETGVIEGTLDSILDMLKTIVNFITGFFVPVDGTLPSLDFGPLYFPLTNKFPFCIPFDLINTFKQMVASKEAPKFTVKFPDNIFIGGGSFTVDFSQFNNLVIILRYFILLSFCISLIVLTKKLIN